MGDEVIRIGPLSVRFLIDGSQSAGAVSVFEVGIPAAARVPAPHSHDAFEETLHGLEGVSTWTIDGEEHELRPGDVLHIPRGVVHGFVNRGPADARALCVATPGTFGPRFFREMGAVFAAAGGSPARDDVAAVMARHGLSAAR